MSALLTLQLLALTAEAFIDITIACAETFARGHTLRRGVALPPDAASGGRLVLSGHAAGRTSFTGIHDGR